ncbi:hypothetical protein NLI96_g4346 [Meripilus lineatus]|uniref:DUF6534 domain-containing protein n=1 Tax=Meripilus lineatus TaxID=2056292 RepID=A0AAD5YFS9_9APHY|nr:hypothetical protein NLI96_g4346 [Physisporinus lineatus]
MSEHATAIPTASGLLGGYVIEIFIAILLYGISIAQSYVYWLNCGQDAAYLKIIVSIVMSSGVCVASGMLVVLFVQAFYLRRVWILSHRNKLLTIVPSLILLLRISFGFATCALTYTMKTWTEFREEIGPMFTLSAGIALSALMDLLIAGILIFHLHSSKTGFKETDHLIQKLMSYAVNTGAITMICSIGVVFIFVFQKDSLLFAGLWLMCSKLYANSMFGTLNARQLLRKQPSSFNASDMGRFHATTGPMRPIEIFQESTKVTDGEAFQMSHTGSNDDGSRRKVGELA